MKKQWAMTFLIGVSFFKPVYGEIFFPETAPSTQMESRYTESLVRGKDIYSVNVFDNQIYFVFVSAQDITILNCPYPVRQIQIGDTHVIQQTSKPGESFLTLNAKPGSALNQDTTVQIVCENQFTAVLNVKVVSRQEANKIVNLMDGRKTENLPGYTKASFDALKEKQRSELKKREDKLKILLYQRFVMYPIGQEIRIGGSTLTLVNLVICGHDYIFNLQFKGTDTVSIAKNKLFLYLTAYEPFLFSDQKKAKTLLYPQETIQYDPENESQRVSILFSVPPQEKATSFYSELHLTRDIIFDVKINLESLNTELTTPVPTHF